MVELVSPHIVTLVTPESLLIGHTAKYHLLFGAVHIRDVAGGDEEKRAGYQRCQVAF